MQSLVALFVWRIRLSRVAHLQYYTVPKGEIRGGVEVARATAGGGEASEDEYLAPILLVIPCSWNAACSGWTSSAGSTPLEIDRDYSFKINRYNKVYHSGPISMKHDLVAITCGMPSPRLSRVSWRLVS